MAEVLVEVEDRVATVTMNRPEQLNAWNAAMFSEFPRAIRRCDDDDAVRVIIVTGAGRGFCAGFDPTAGVPENVRALDPFPWEMHKPVIAAINGAAVGMGITLPLHWDIRIAAEDAKLGFVFVRRGLLPEANSIWLLPRLVGLARATELMLTGRIFTGREALELGLVHESVPRDRVLPRAREIAREIAEDTAPVAVALTKRLLWEQLSIEDPSEAYDHSHALTRWLRDTPDVREGMAAFVEKRKPRWTMSPSAPLPSRGDLKRS